MDRHDIYAIALHMTTERDEGAAVARVMAAPAWSAGNTLAALFLRDASPLALLLLAGIPVMLACWAIFSPPVILSTEMTWDLLFNLTGAWHLRYGHVPHVDFHEPVGALNFALTHLGFQVVGPSPRALLVGIAIVTAVLFAFACFATWRRLPLAPAALFVVFVCLLVLRPANVGDLPNAYSFAMTYNRYGWSGVALVALVLFLPPRRGRAGDIVEMAMVTVVLVALLYLKVTYFAVALGSVVVALAVSAHVAARWKGWAVVLLIGLATALAPFNERYLGDLVAAARAGIVRDDAAFYFNDFAENLGQYAPYVAAIVVALWLWRRGTAPSGVPLAAAFLLLAGMALLSQNSQAHGVPLALVIFFLLYQTLAPMPMARDRAGKLAVLGVLLIFPLAAVVSAAVSIGGYQARIRAGYLHVVGTTNLVGLAVPAEPDGIIAAFASGRGGYRLLNRARALRPRYELSPYEYVQTLQEAAVLLREHGLASGKIAVFDQINPLPFMLGLEPPRGGNLWSGNGAPLPSAEACLKEVDHVLIPKFTTNMAWTEKAQAIYRTYLERHFKPRLEGPSWIVLTRQSR